MIYEDMWGIVSCCPCALTESTQQEQGKTMENVWMVLNACWCERILLKESLPWFKQTLSRPQCALDASGIFWTNCSWFKHVRTIYIYIHIHKRFLNNPSGAVFLTRAVRQCLRCNSHGGGCSLMYIPRVRCFADMHSEILHCQQTWLHHRAEPPWVFFSCTFLLLWRCVGGEV
jgi:hypothetical protein